MNSIVIYQDKQMYVTWVTKGGKHIPMYGPGEKPFTDAQKIKHHKDSVSKLTKEKKEIQSTRKEMNQEYERLVNEGADRKTAYDATLKKIESGPGREEDIAWDIRDHKDSIKELSVDSITSEKKTFKKIKDDDIEDWADESYGKWGNDINFHEMSHLRTYKDDTSINDALRTKKISELTKDEKVTKAAMDSALKKGSAPENFVTYRGMGNVPALDKLSMSELKGKTFTDKAYVSTSLNKRFANSAEDKYHCTIKVPKGKKGAYIDKVLEYDDDEFLLPRNSKFKITKAVKKKAHIELTMEVQ